MMWEQKNISDIAEIVSGGTPKSTVSDYWEGDIQWLTPKDMGKLENEKISITSRTITQAGLAKSSAKLVPPNSVILSTRAPIGHLAINEVPMSFNQGCRGLIPNKNLNERYLFYFLKGNIDLLNSLGTGTTFKELSARALSNVQIPLPTLEEQKRIVAILDEAFAGIDQAITNTEQNIQNVRELFESYLNSIFTQKGEGWEEKKISDLGKVQTGSTPKTSEKDNFGSYIPFIKPADFNPNGSLNYDNAGLSQKGISGSRLIKAGSVLMVCIGATIGKCGYCESDVTANQQINAITPIENIDAAFLYYQMITPNIQKQVIAGSGQATLPIINKTKWSNIYLNIPNYDEQLKYSDKLKILSKKREALEQIYQKKLVALKELKQSLLQKAFAGELTSDISEAA